MPIYAEIPDAPPEEPTEEPTEEQAREMFFQALDTFSVSEDLDDPINTDVALDHYLEQLGAREREIAQNREILQRRRDMLDSWEREANGSLERECQWLRQQIETWGRTYDFGKKKSRSLPNGTFGFRSTPARIDITDMAAAVTFAEAEGLEIKKTVNKTPLMAHLKSTGLLPDGCEYVEGGESFYVKAGA